MGARKWIASMVAGEKMRPAFGMTTQVGGAWLRTWARKDLMSGADPTAQAAPTATFMHNLPRAHLLAHLVGGLFDQSE